MSKAGIANREQLNTDDTNDRKGRDRSWHRELLSRSTKAIVFVGVEEGSTRKGRFLPFPSIRVIRDQLLPVRDAGSKRRSADNANLPATRLIDGADAPEGTGLEATPQTSWGLLLPNAWRFFISGSSQLAESQS